MINVLGGYIDFNKLSQEDIKRHEICHRCHKSIEIITKLENPITYTERLLLPTGEIWFCKECVEWYDDLLISILRTNN